MGFKILWSVFSFHENHFKGTMKDWHGSIDIGLFYSMKNKPYWVNIDSVYIQVHLTVIFHHHIFTVAQNMDLLSLAILS